MDEDFGFITGGLILGVVITIFIFAICGFFNPNISKLDLDKDALAKYHTLKYYPEYENYTFEYKTATEIDCDLGTSGVELFYNEQENRDGMSVLGSGSNLKLCFDDFEIEDVLDEILEEYKN